MDREVGQYLSVNLYGGLVQSVHQPAVGQVELPGCRIDANDPKGAKLAFALAAVTVCVLAGLDNSLLGHAKRTPACPVVPLGLVEYLLVSGMRDNRPLGSWHRYSPVSWSVPLRVGQHLPYGLGILSCNGGLCTQMPFSFCALLGQDVPGMRLDTLETATCSPFEALCRATISFQFWHLLVPVLLLAQGPEYHHQLSAFQSWSLLDLTMLVQIFFYAIQQGSTKFLMHHFSPPEAYGHF